MHKIVRDIFGRDSKKHQENLNWHFVLDVQMSWCGKKWNESGLRPPLCTYRLNWVRRTSWRWWDDWDDTVLQTQDSKFESWRFVAKHATARSRRLPTILIFTRGWGRNIFVSFKPPRPGAEPRTLAWKAVVLTTTLRLPPVLMWQADYSRMALSVRRAIVALWRCPGEVRKH